jgi:hypothetical protein
MAGALWCPWCRGVCIALRWLLVPGRPSYDVDAAFMHVVRHERGMGAALLE